MNRRNYLKAMAAILPAAGFAQVSKTAPKAAAPAEPKAAAAPPPIMLHCDLFLNPAKEKEMLANYHKTFRPAIRKQPGFVSVSLLKLRKENQGKAPAGASYRLMISFKTEEERVTWTKTDLHQQAWGTIEACLVGEKFNALLYDPVV
jgi:heme-degrading monooxygenase HmoA